MNEEILENVNDRLDDAFERGRRMVKDEEFARRLDELRIRTENSIRKHPFRSVAIGLFTGYVLGKLFSHED